MALSTRITTFLRGDDQVRGDDLRRNFEQDVSRQSQQAFLRVAALRRALHGVQYALDPIGGQVSRCREECLHELRLLQFADFGRERIHVKMLQSMRCTGCRARAPDVLARVLQDASFFIHKLLAGDSLCSAETASGRGSDRVAP